MKQLLWLTLTALYVCNVSAQAFKRRDGLRIMFFNVENYFEPKADSSHPRREFSPTSARRWTDARFREKSNGIYKVIANAGETSPPDIVGLCEVENRTVLDRLLNGTPLGKAGYGIIHRDSPDRRGIDAALLYIKESFRVIDSAFIPVRLGRGRPTRDIVYVKGVTPHADTLHVMVVHAPSKYGGAAASAPSRAQFAAILCRYTDSLYRISPRLNLVVMGDFNDTPDSESITQVLHASSNMRGSAPDTLYNLAMTLHRKGKGSIKYRGKWELIDLMLVSGSMLNPNNPIYCTADDYSIFDAPYLLEDDSKYSGSIPRRTYEGTDYHGGISDHLPIILNIRRKH